MVHGTKNLMFHIPSGGKTLRRYPIHILAFPSILRRRDGGLQGPWDVKEILNFVNNNSPLSKRPLVENEF